MKEKMLKIIKKPYLFIIFLVLGIVIGNLELLHNVCRYSAANSIITETHIGSGEIRYFDVCDGGRIVMNLKTKKRTGFICDADINTGKILRMTGDELLLGYGTVLSRFNVIAGENGEVWLHFVRWSENSAAIASEAILKIGADGKSLTMIGGINYSDMADPPTREPRFTAFAHRAGALTFAYSDMQKTEFYRIDDALGTQTVTGEYIPGDNVFVSDIFSLEEGFLVVQSDGKAVRVACDGSVREVVYSSASAHSVAANVDNINNAVEMDGKLYVVTGCVNDTLYIVENGALTPVATIPLKDSDSPKLNQLDAADGKIYLGLKDRIEVFDGSDFTTLDTGFEMPFANALVSLLPLISLIFIGIGVVFFIVFTIYSKRSLLFKQLLLMVPAMVIFSFIICRQVGANILGMFTEQEAHSTVAVCDICAGKIDGERVKEMLVSGEWTEQQYIEMRASLLDELRYNQGYWNDIYDVRLCVPDESGMALIFADSRQITQPFENIDLCVYIPMLDGFRSDNISNVSVFQIPGDSTFTELMFFGGSPEKIVATAPICDKEGEIYAYLIVSTDDFTLMKVQYSVIMLLVFTMGPFMLMLVFIISLICVVLSFRLRKATKTVIRIADGDLTARINNRSQDELGEICRQVNTMASNLEVIFDEKDKNEQFYYKFVPEKFRELLGKEKITDLALGDAESKEFSVLFCDIRSFSINSEMLTAKENFEFVNVIYGITGPIIREYGGFVDKYIGDAVMALFESPDDAVQAGIKIYHSIVLDPSVAERLNVRDINIGIGIHTGIARIGIVGEEERLSGTVISDTVNLSSRLESLTKTYHTAMIVSKDTIDRMKDPDSLNKRYIGMVQVAGVNDVTPLYEILDCLGEEEREKRTANKDEFREAVRLFHLGRREEAVGLLKEIQSSGRADSVIDMYCNYIEGLRDEDKGNVFRFVRK